MSLPRVAVVQIPGVNCEYETTRALEAVGLGARIVRWNEPASVFSEFDAYVLPGGFAFQDRIRAGAIAAKLPAVDRIAAESESGKPVLGICNGAQVLVEAGLVPGFRRGRVEMALAPNKAPRRAGYLCRWAWLRVEPGPGSAWFASSIRPGEVVPMPIAHGEGCYYADEETLAGLKANNQILWRYVDAQGQATDASNPNGSLDNIAGSSGMSGISSSDSRNPTTWKSPMAAPESTTAASRSP
jgi:phosphoribosylformylglycinamidine synthase